MNWLWVLVLIIVVCIVAALVVRSIQPQNVLGGALPRNEKHIVVDLLNLVHWYTQKDKITSADIRRTIKKTAPILKKKYPGEVIYVTKDMDRPGVETDLDYEKMAEKQKIQISLVLKDAPESNFRAPIRDPDSHSAKGRDDFVVGMLSWQLRCKALTNDSMNDFAEVKRNTQPFFVQDYHWVKGAKKSYIVPNMLDVRRPPRVKFSSALCPPLRGSKCAFY